MFLCCHLISNWFKFCVKIFRNASKNWLTCALLAIRKILSYIPDQSDLRQQSINISNICSSPVVLHWQPRAVLVLAGLEFDVSTITCYVMLIFYNKKERQSPRLCILHYLNRYRRMRNCFNPILMLISVFNVTIGLCPPAYTPDKQGHTQMNVDRR